MHLPAVSRKPELMSPAGYWPQLEAAVEAGADAVYFGLKHFSARAKVGFSLAELPDVFRTLHRRGVRGFVTFNTLIFEHELAEAARTIAAVAEADADALIIQDPGIVRLARRIAPDIELHASTQMSITSAEGVQFACDLGVDRVTLARELSLDEIRAIRAKTDCELEMFVHGALCVAYSGQCFSSEAWGGRSANRGQCAQACRLPYEMIVDDRLRPLADTRYLLSPGDLYALRHVREIVELGVSALKIEGRYKDADYVALTTSAYRKAIDEAWADMPLSISAAEELRLEQVYSRGLGPYFVEGTNHQKVVNGRAPRHRGVRMGPVIQVDNDSVTIEPAEAHAVSPLKAGDGLVFDAADWRSPEEPEEGSRVFQVLPKLDGNLELRFGNGAVHFSRIRPSDLVWRTNDPDIEKMVRPFTEAKNPVQKQGVNVKVVAHQDAPLSMEWSLEKNPQLRVKVRSADNLAAAQSRTSSAESLRIQLERLGNTAYELRKLGLEVSGSPFIPLSLLNQLRREAVEQLEAAQDRSRQVTVNDPSPILEEALRGNRHAVAQTLRPQIHLLVRNADQLEAALSLAPASVTLDYLDLYGLRPSVERIKATGIAARVATPRILKPGESRITNFLLSLNCSLLIRATGILDELRRKDHPLLIGDFSLNAANSLSAEALLDLGLSRLTPTHDLNADQIADLARKMGSERVEVVAYQHLPVFHTEHCVFCRFLSTGTSFRDCGRPCEKHSVALRDPSGRAHPVIADVGCRNTVFRAEAQQASAHLDLWLHAGIQHFRLEFVHESADQVREVTNLFSSTLFGGMSSAQLHRELKRVTPDGTTEGSLFIPSQYQALPVL